MLTIFSCIFYPYLVSFPFNAIPICPPRNPLFTCLHSFYTWFMETITYTCVQSSSPCVLLVVSLEGEEGKVP